MKRIAVQLQAGNAGMAIGEMETYLAAWPNPQTSAKLGDLKGEYDLMADYWLRGADDPERDEQYRRLLQRLYVLFANIAIHRHLHATSYLQTLYATARSSGQQWSLSAIRQEMEGFVSEVAMLELEPDHLRKEKSKALYSRHQKQMNTLFNYVLTSRIWTSGVGQGMEELLLSPTVDSNDQQLLLTAITLSLMNRFDIAKFRTLLNVYRLSQDEPVRQRALVGWTLSIDDNYLGIYPELHELMEELLQQESVCRELTELQMQLILTLKSEETASAFNQEIMPDLMKNNGLNITKNIIEEVEDDPMEDVLHPEASEERMRKLEDAYERIKKMEQEGADVFFSQFAMMKRFPFFYDASNWLVPFYMQHPDISSYLERIGDNLFIENVVQHRLFCNSDKYSLVMVLQDTLSRLSPKLLQMLKESHGAMVNEVDELISQPMIIRRTYLMDLYRFFRLFPNRNALCNPFDERKGEAGVCLFFGSALFQGTPLETYKREVVPTLLKHQMTTAAQVLLNTFPDDMHDVQYYLWQKQYEEALALDPDNVRALTGQARRLFAAGCYAEAEECYDRLLLTHPEKTGYLLNKAVCLVKMEEYDEAQRWLFQLNYEHPDDLNVSRVLAWALTCSGKLEQATNIYEQLTAEPQPTAEDFQNQGYCLWLTGRKKEAAESFRKYVSMLQLADDSTEPLFDEHWLTTRGIDATDIKMMEALVKRDEG